MKKTYLILFIVLSFMGLVSGIYLKYLKTYQSDVQLNLKPRHGVSKQRHLNLNENIGFLEELDRTFAAVNIDRTDANQLPEALERFKTINRFSIGLIIASGFLFLGSVRKLYKIGTGLSRF